MKFKKINNSNNNLVDLSKIRLNILRISISKNCSMKNSLKNKNNFKKKLKKFLHLKVLYLFKIFNNNRIKNKNFAKIIKSLAINIKSIKTSKKN